MLELVDQLRLDLQYAFVMGFMFKWLFDHLQAWTIRRIERNDRKLRALEMQWLDDMTKKRDRP